MFHVKHSIFLKKTQKNVSRETFLCYNVENEKKEGQN